MIKEAKATAESIEEAKVLACQELNVSVEEASFEVLQQPEKKKFGLFGGSPAIVRAYVEVTPLDSAKKYLLDVLNQMGIQDITIEAEETEEGAVLNVIGEDIGFIIGHRGETLDALQYLTGLVANHVDNNYYRISVNIGNYREKREKTLEILGRKLAFKACKTGAKTSLEPMNPYERRIIHTAVQKVRGATSWSEGEGVQRHIVIGPDPNQKPSYSRRKGGYNRGRNSSGEYARKPRQSSGYQRRQYSDSRPPQDSLFSSFEKESTSFVERESKNEAPSAFLYGKIEPRSSTENE